MRAVHVIPVPGGMSADQAWSEIQVMGRLVEQRSWWRRLRHRLVHGRTRWAVFELDDEDQPEFKLVEQPAEFGGGWLGRCRCGWRAWSSDSEMVCHRYLEHDCAG